MKQYIKVNVEYLTFSLQLIPITIHTNNHYNIKYISINLTVMNISAEQTNKCVSVYTISCSFTSGEHGKETLSQQVQTLHFQLIFSWDRISVHVHTYAQHTIIIIV
jgi:hypothetical protein